MNTSKIVLFVLGLALAYSGNAQQANPYSMQENNKQEYEQAVRESLGTLRGMINADNAQAMGFRSDKEVGQVSAGIPIPIVMIQLDELRSYQQGNNVRPLFKYYQQQLLPLSVGNEVRSSITLERKDQGLSAVSYGSPGLARALNNVREQAAKQKAIPLARFYAVHVAALRQYFIAYDDTAGKVMFVPVLDNKELDLQAGRELRAEDALARLKTAAQGYNDLPI